MATPALVKRRTPEMHLLEEVIAERGIRPGDYALFFTTGEGEYLPMDGPDPIEETSGNLVDRLGRMFAWWVGWDPDRRRPALVDWERVEPEPDWSDAPEFIAAGRRLAIAHVTLGEAAR